MDELTTEMSTYPGICCLAWGGSVQCHVAHRDLEPAGRPVLWAFSEPLLWLSVNERWHCTSSPLGRAIASPLPIMNCCSEYQPSGCAKTLSGALRGALQSVMRTHFFLSPPSFLLLFCNQEVLVFKAISSQAASSVAMMSGALWKKKLYTLKTQHF